MGTSATRAKQRYNEKNYVQLNLKISPELKERLDSLKEDMSYPELLSMGLDALDGGLLSENRELKEKLAKMHKIAKRYKAELEAEKSKGLFEVLKEKILGVD